MRILRPTVTEKLPRELHTFTRLKMPSACRQRSVLQVGGTKAWWWVRGWVGGVRLNGVIYCSGSKRQLERRSNSTTLSALCHCPQPSPALLNSSTPFYYNSPSTHGKVIVGEMATSGNAFSSAVLLTK